MKLHPRTFANLYSFNCYTSECKELSTLCRRLVTFVIWVYKHNGFVQDISISGDDTTSWVLSVYCKDIEDIPEVKEND